MTGSSDSIRNDLKLIPAWQSVLFWFLGQSQNEDLKSTIFGPTLTLGWVKRTRRRIPCRRRSSRRLDRQSTDLDVIGKGQWRWPVERRVQRLKKWPRRWWSTSSSRWNKWRMVISSFLQLLDGSQRSSLNLFQMSDKRCKIWDWECSP